MIGGIPRIGIGVGVGMILEAMDLEKDTKADMKVDMKVADVN